MPCWLVDTSLDWLGIGVLLGVWESGAKDLKWRAWRDFPPFCTPSREQGVLRWADTKLHLQLLPCPACMVRSRLSQDAHLARGSLLDTVAALHRSWIAPILSY